MDSIFEIYHKKLADYQNCIDAEHSSHRKNYVVHKKFVQSQKFC